MFGTAQIIFVIISCSGDKQVCLLVLQKLKARRIKFKVQDLVNHILDLAYQKSGWFSIGILVLQNISER